MRRMWPSGRGNAPGGSQCPQNPIYPSSWRGMANGLDTARFNFPHLLPSSCALLCAILHCVDGASGNKLAELAVPGGERRMDGRNRLRRHCPPPVNAPAVPKKKQWRKGGKSTNVTSVGLLAKKRSSPLTTLKANRARRRRKNGIRMGRGWWTQRRKKWRGNGGWQGEEAGSKGGRGRRGTSAD
jgi:hypothetical protein